MRSAKQQKDLQRLSGESLRREGAKRAGWDVVGNVQAVSGGPFRCGTVSVARGSQRVRARRGKRRGWLRRW